jgi:hypothetical protein
MKPREWLWPSSKDEGETCFGRRWIGYIGGLNEMENPHCGYPAVILYIVGARNTLAFHITSSQVVIDA